MPPGPAPSMTDDGDFRRKCPWCPLVTQGGIAGMLAHLNLVHSDNLVDLEPTNSTDPLR